MNSTYSGLKTRIGKAPAGAVFSRDRKHRYLLWRTWNDEPLMLFIGLNPSMADEKTNDPTIRRIIGFAKREDAGGVLVANLFSYCATDPRDLKAAAKPVRPENDHWLREAQAMVSKIVACWGGHGTHLERSVEFLPKLDSAFCFGKTKSGEPRHPLYLKADARLQSLGL